MFENIIHYTVSFSVRKAYNEIGTFTGISADAENMRDIYRDLCKDTSAMPGAHTEVTENQQQEVTS